MQNHYYLQIELNKLPLYLIASFDIGKNNTTDIWNRQFNFYITTEARGVEGLGQLFTTKTINKILKKYLLKDITHTIDEIKKNGDLLIATACKGKITTF